MLTRWQSKARRAMRQQLVGVGAVVASSLTLVPASSHARDAQGEASGLPRVLVIGDSTAAGTGARPSESVAARLAADFPHVTVENVGVDGARITDTLDQLARDQGVPIRLLIIQTGGNDILHLAAAQTLERDMKNLLAAALTRAEHVVLITPGNLRSAPRFSWPLGALLGWRSRVANEAMSRVAAELKVAHVSMFKPVEDDPFAQEPARYFSPDGVHPSGDGYGLWYRTLRVAWPLTGWLADRGATTLPDLAGTPGA